MNHHVPNIISSPRLLNPRWDIILIITTYAFLFSLTWIGYIGSDDDIYIRNALKRIIDPFLIGTNHWDVRVTLTWPMALSFLTFGKSEFAAALPTLIYTTATGVIFYFFLMRQKDRTAGLVAVALLASSPILAFNATSLRIDSVETFFVIASLITLLIAIDQKGSIAFLLLTGILAGLAFLTRPTTVALLIFYGLLFLTGYRMERNRYLLIAIGFIFVWLSESFYYLSGTGNFFHRLNVDFNHDQVVRASGLLDAILISPIKLVWGSHSFGIAFWCLPFASWQLLRNRGSSTYRGSIAQFLTLFAISWVVTFSAFASKLVLDPRYLAPASAAALVVVALWVSMLASTGKMKLATTIISLCLASHVLAIYLENKDYTYAERWLLSLTKLTTEPIYTDPQTYERASFLLELSDSKSQIIPDPAPPGALFLSVPKNNARGKYNQQRWDPASYAPGLWDKVDILSPERKKIGIIIEATGLHRMLPAHIVDKINYPNKEITLYRRPQY